MKKILSFATIVLLANFISAQSGSQSFLTSGDFTVPAGVTSITVEVIGGGGGGGINGTGGGGGGGYSMGTYSVVPLATIPVTIGVGGGTGTAGGTTIVGTLNQATGGEPGIWVPNPDVGGGGAGGIGSGGTINYNGGTGGGGYYTYFGGGGGGAAGSLGNGSNGGDTIPWTGVCQTPGGSGGAGGGIHGGSGGKGAGFTDANCNITDPAANGMSYGGGGGGGNGNGGGPGMGYSGYALISWGSDPCSTPDSLTAYDIQTTSAMLDWTENGIATAWHIEWGLTNFTLGTGNPQLVLSKPYLLEGLMPNTSYDYYVQAECGGTGTSTWSGPFTFNTAVLGTADNEIEGFTFNSNPMSEVLHLRATNTIERVLIYNILGQKVIDQIIGTTSAQLNVSNLSTGDYLMKVVSEGKTGMYRLLKK